MKKIVKTIFHCIFLTYAALLFNGEIYAHGINALSRLDLLFFYLIFSSLIYAFINLTNHNTKATFIFGAIIGLLLETFVTKSILEHPIFLGINWLSVLIQIMYWGIATILPFYLYRLINEKKKIKKNITDAAILAYLLIEVFVGPLTSHPNTLLWIISGISLGVFVIPKMLKNKLFI